MTTKLTKEQIAEMSATARTDLERAARRHTQLEQAESEVRAAEARLAAARAAASALDTEEQAARQAAEAERRADLQARFDALLATRPELYSKLDAAIERTAALVAEALALGSQLHNAAIAAGLGGPATYSAGERRRIAGRIRELLGPDGAKLPGIDFAQPNERGPLSRDAAEPTMLTIMPERVLHGPR